MLASLAWAPGLTALAPGDLVPDFKLPRWQSNELVSLHQFHGQVVVLDFFAHWCLPCLNATTDLEEKVQKHFAQQNGNAHGIPVRVISINIERAQPDRTAQFIAKTGASLVLHDPDGSLLKVFGATGIPFLAVIDGSKSTANAPAFQLAYVNAGFEGADKMRALIDRIGAAGDLKPAEVSSSSLPRTHQLDADFEALWASDVLLTQSGVGYTSRSTRSEWSVGAGFNTLGIDFESPDIFTTPTEVEETRQFYQGALKWQSSSRLAWLASAGFYEGFTDYRSAWLHEYYRQVFGDFGYAEADPRGYQLAAGMRVEYWPGRGFFQAEFSYLNDEIAPSAEIDPNDGSLLFGLDELTTRTLRLSTENVLMKRVRALNEFRISETSGRETRFSYVGSVNVAFGESWVLRAQGGVTTEQPEFDAWFVSGTLEYEIRPGLLVHAAGRYYADTGEIENSLAASNAAPGVRAWQAGAGVRWVSGKSSLKLFVAPYFTRYEAFGLGTFFYSRLYQDRDWGIVQLGYSLEL
jgi:thiol-disulfide isomerase/thioredoxin